MRTSCAAVSSIGCPLPDEADSRRDEIEGKGCGHSGLSEPGNKTLPEEARAPSRADSISGSGARSSLTLAGLAKEPPARSCSERFRTTASSITAPRAWNLGLSHSHRLGQGRSPPRNFVSGRMPHKSTAAWEGRQKCRLLIRSSKSLTRFIQNFS